MKLTGKDKQSIDRYARSAVIGAYRESLKLAEELELEYLNAMKEAIEYRINMLKNNTK
jgi:hypothetical protein